MWYIDDIRKSVCSACICSAETCAGLPCAEEKMVSYNRLWETMEKRKISQYRLIKEFGLSSGQMSRLKKNTYSFRFPKQANLEEVMRIISQVVGNVNYVIKGNKCYVTSKE